MVWQTRLRGAIQLSIAAAQRILLCRDEGFNLDGYIRGCVYRHDHLIVQVEGRLYQHTEFISLLAHCKDVSGIDTIEQEGASPGAWFGSGLFFVRPKAWAYAGRGPRLDSFGAPIPGLVGGRFPDPMALSWQRVG